MGAIVALIIFVLFCIGVFLNFYLEEKKDHNIEVA